MQLDLGQTIGVIANISVIAGIIFLGVEVRQNNRLLAAQARYSLRQYRNDIADTIMSPHALESMHAYANDANASHIDISASRMVALKTIELWEWQYGEYVEGMLRYENLPIGAWRLWFDGKGQAPIPLKEIWEMRRDVMNPEFVRFFEENVIRESPSPDVTKDQEL